MENGFLNIQEAADYLGVKKSTLYHITARKCIRYYKAGGLKFLEEDLKNYILNGVVEQIKS